MYFFITHHWLKDRSLIMGGGRWVRKGGRPQTQKCVTGDGLKFLYVQHV